MQICDSSFPLSADACRNITCQNGASCVAFPAVSHKTVAYAVCRCTTGFTGQFCETELSSGIITTVSISTVSPATYIPTNVVTSDVVTTSSGEASSPSKKGSSSYMTTLFDIDVMSTTEPPISTSTTVSKIVFYFQHKYCRLNIAIKKLNSNTLK